MVNFVLPPFPAILPIARDKWSPFRGLTAKTQTKLDKTIRQNDLVQVNDNLPSVTSNDSKNSSSNLISASASCEWTL